jgi:hypothetical protein
MFLEKWFHLDFAELVISHDNLALSVVGRNGWLDAPACINYAVVIALEDHGTLAIKTLEAALRIGLYRPPSACSYISSTTSDITL